MDKHAGVRLVSMARDGAGLTSQRIRDRLVEQLQAAGIHNDRVLEALANTTRDTCLSMKRSYRELMRIRPCRLALVKPSPSPTSSR